MNNSKCSQKVDSVLGLGRIHLISYSHATVTQEQADALKEEDEGAFMDQFDKICKCIRVRTNLLNLQVQKSSESLTCNVGLSNRKA